MPVAAAEEADPLAWLLPPPPPPPVSVLRRYAMARRSRGATVRPLCSSLGAVLRRPPFQRDQQARGPRASHQRDACGCRSSTHTLRVVVPTWRRSSKFATKAPRTRCSRYERSPAAAGADAQYNTDDGRGGDRRKGTDRGRTCAGLSPVRTRRERTGGLPTTRGRPSQLSHRTHAGSAHGVGRRRRSRWFLAVGRPPPRLSERARDSLRPNVRSPSRSRTESPLLLLLPAELAS